MRNGITTRHPLGDLVQDNELREASERDESVQDQRSVEMKAEVVCYSGYKGDERPVRFRLSGEEYFVEELLDQWYGPQECFFKVRANDGNLYILRRRSSVPEGEWSLESFRDMKRGG
jgi:hypothetical protein